METFVRLIRTQAVQLRLCAISIDFIPHCLNRIISLIIRILNWAISSSHSMSASLSVADVLIARVACSEGTQVIMFILKQLQKGIIVAMNKPSWLLFLIIQNTILPLLLLDSIHLPWCMVTIVSKSCSLLQESKFTVRDCVQYALVDSLVFVHTWTFKSSLWPASTALPFANSTKIGGICSTLVWNKTLSNIYLEAPLSNSTCRLDLGWSFTSQRRLLSSKLWPFLF